MVSSKASVSFVQARMGVAPGWGGAGRLVELLGRRKALRLLLSSRKVTVQEGLELGLFDDQVQLDLVDISQTRSGVAGAADENKS